jgi:hypothetical protein
VLERELAALPSSVRVRSYDADEALAGLPISSKLYAEDGFLRTLHEAGREAARRQEEGASPLAAE